MLRTKIVKKIICSYGFRMLITGGTKIQYLDPFSPLDLHTLRLQPFSWDTARSVRWTS